MLPIPMATRVQVWTIIERPLPIPEIIETRPVEEPFTNGFEEDDFSAEVYEDAFEFEVEDENIMTRPPTDNSDIDFD